MKRFLLCTDLDRTLIPNGSASLSPTAAGRFRQLVRREELCLAYVTGRHRKLIEDAIADYGLPTPDFAIADVGTTIFEVTSHGWQSLKSWEGMISPDWRGLRFNDLRELLRIFPELRLQEEEKQAPFKLSYYVALGEDSLALARRIKDRLLGQGVHANLIWSVDELAGIGLLDVLPAGAGKLSAIRFLMNRGRFSLANTVFAGDSGNDLDVLMSDIPAVLVANAHSEIKEMASRQESGALYVAQGGYLGMNGNYCAGILEGLAYFWPEAARWLHEIEPEKDD
jgi:sucrose-6F-phosphate phosphohydrolase